MGSIRIIYTDLVFYIKLPGELSYDPASQSSDKLWVDGAQLNKLIVFVCILIKAALLGANSKFIRRLYTVMKPIIAKYYKKEELFKWMYIQVKFACMKKKQPPSYAEFLRDRKSESQSIKDYLNNVNLLQEGHIQEILPPQEFFNAIAEEPEFKNSQKLNLYEDEGRDDDLYRDFSPELEEDTVPSVEEMLEDLKKVKERYEKGMTAEFEKMQKLENARREKRISVFLLDKGFGEQCPII